MSDLDALIKGPNPPPREKSRAVVANGGTQGVVLWYAGEDITDSVRELSQQLGDLGLDDAPDGISIWEGIYCTSQTNHPLDPVEYDTYPSGTFRAPTDDEWQAIRANRNPWAPTTKPEKE